MSKTREIACVHYICEGNCDLGKELLESIARYVRHTKRFQEENLLELIIEGRKWIK